MAGCVVFVGGVRTDTATTNSSGVATAPVFTANGTTGTYTVTATVSGVATPANFSVMNTAVVPSVGQIPFNIPNLGATSLIIGGTSGVVAIGHSAIQLKSSSATPSGV